MKTRILYVVFPLAVVLAIPLLQAQPPAPVAAPVTPTIEFAPSELAKAQVRELRISLPLTGTLQPVHQAVIKAKVAGEIREVLVREGEAVIKGQVLARLDDTEFKARLEEKLALLESGKAQLALAEKSRANNTALLQKKVISESAFDSIQSNYEVSQANIRVQQAQVDLARIALEDTVVYAPMDGIVAERFIQPGEKTAVDGKLFSLMDLTELEIEAAVPATEIARVKPGQEVAFKVHGYGERPFKGTVARINPSTQSGSRSIMVYGTVANPESLLRGGLFAKGELITTRVAQAITVPLSAVREENGETVVYRVENATLVRQPVKLGLKNPAEGLVEIAAGLEPGAWVVSTRGTILDDGLPVKVSSI